MKQVENALKTGEKEGGVLLRYLTKIGILPFTAVESVQFFRCQEEFLHDTILRIELHKLTVQEGVETAQVGAHAVGRQCCAV